MSLKFIASRHLQPYLDFYQISGHLIISSINEMDLKSDSTSFSYVSKLYIPIPKKEKGWKLLT